MFLLIPFSKALHLSIRINITFLVASNFSLPAVQHQHRCSRILGGGRDEKCALAAWRPCNARGKADKLARTLDITFMQNRKVLSHSHTENLKYGTPRRNRHMACKNMLRSCSNYIRKSSIFNL